MNSFFVYDQNNSGGRFEAPAAYVLVQAKSLEEANSLFEKHVSPCGSSGTYSDYDVCGCCPCCGHRWTGSRNEQPSSGKSIERYLLKTFFGSTGTALICNSGELIVGDSEERFEAIRFALLGDEKEKVENERD